MMRSTMPNGDDVRKANKTAAAAASKAADNRVVSEIYPLLFPDNIMAIINNHSFLRNGNKFEPLPSLNSAGIVANYLLANYDKEWVVQLLGRFLWVPGGPAAPFRRSHHQSVVLLRLFCSPEYHHSLLESADGSYGKKPTRFCETVLAWTPWYQNAAAHVIAYCVCVFLPNQNTALLNAATAFIMSSRPQQMLVADLPMAMPAGEPTAQVLPEPAAIELSLPEPTANHPPIPAVHAGQASLPVRHGQVHEDAGDQLGSAADDGQVPSQGSHDDIEEVITHDRDSFLGQLSNSKGRIKFVDNGNPLAISSHIECISDDEGRLFFTGSSHGSGAPWESNPIEMSPPEVEPLAERARYEDASVGAQLGPAALQRGFSDDDMVMNSVMNFSGTRRLSRVMRVLTSVL